MSAPSWISWQNSVPKQTSTHSTWYQTLPPSTPGSLLSALHEVGLKTTFCVPYVKRQHLYLFCFFFRPFSPGDEQCRYMCQSDGENFIVSRGSQFVDGTRCESDSPPPFGSTAACLRGRCQVGMTNCDSALPKTDFTLSVSRLSKCAVCLRSAVRLWRRAALWESEGRVWGVRWRRIVLQFDLWLLHWRSGKR